MLPVTVQVKIDVLTYDLCVFRWVARCVLSNTALSYYYHPFTILFSINRLNIWNLSDSWPRTMAESPRFSPIPPQIVPIYGPPQPPNVFSMSGQPMFPMPPQFGYPPVAWSPITHFPQSSPISQPAAYNRSEDDLLQQHSPYNNNNNNSNYRSEDDFLQQHSTFYNNNSNYQENSPQNKQQQQFPRRLNRHIYTRSNVSNKVRNYWLI